MGGLMTKIIERNTTIPARRSEIFSTAEDRQPAVDIHVLQGEREMARDNRSLGQFKLEGIPLAPRGVPQIEVTFDIDANGILKVSAKDKGSGKEQSVTISGSSNLEKDEVERMLKDAEAYQREDKKRREEVEMRNQADSLCYTVERKLGAVGGQLPVHEKARLEELLAELKKALQENAAPADKVKALYNELEQAAYAFENLGPEARPGSSEAAPGNKDNVVDAEYDED